MNEARCPPPHEYDKGNCCGDVGSCRHKRPSILAILTKWQDPAHIQLHAGDMTAQERRSVLAVVAAIKAEIEGL